MSDFLRWLEARRFLPSDSGEEILDPDDGDSVFYGSSSNLLKWQLEIKQITPHVHMGDIRHFDYGENYDHLFDCDLTRED